jgi:oligoribonuclease NrnB/cAMP/cGMP phosphodiesterase (DHH superfamily)
MFKKSNKKELEKILYEKDKLIEEKTKEIEKLKEENEKLRKEIEKIQDEKEKLKERIEIYFEELNKIKDAKMVPFLESEIGKELFERIVKFLKESFDFYLNSIGNFKSQTVVFAHLDGDGVCSTAIFERYMPNKKALFIYIPQTRRDLIRKVKAKEIYVFDLILDNKNANYILKVLEEGVKVLWFDHHKESKEIKEDVLKKLREKKVLIIDENFNSCAELIKKYFGAEEDEIANKICKIANECDKEEEKEKEIKIVCTLSHSPFLADKIREELVKYGEIKSDRLIKFYPFFRFVELYEYKKLKKYKIYENKDFLVFYTTSYILSLAPILKRLFNEEKKDVYVIIKKNYVRIKGISKYKEKVFKDLQKKFGKTVFYRGDKGELRINKIDLKEFIDSLNEIYARLNENHHSSLQYSIQ